MEYKIAEIGQVVGGGTPSTKEEKFWNGNIPWISPKDLTNHKSVYISSGENFITEEGLRVGSTLLPKNTVLMSSRAPIGYLAIAKNSICTNQGFKNIICDEKKVQPLYLYYYLKANIEYIKLYGTGATFPEISATTLRKIKINIEEDLATQRRIASILSAYDSLIENNNKRISILEQMAENLYKEWFVRFRFPGYETSAFENGIPKGWEVDKIKNCVKRLPFNKLYKQNELEAKGNVIVIDQSTNDFLGFHNNKPSHFADIDNPIVLFGDHSCKFVLMIKNFSLGENVIPFITISKNKIDNYYLFYAVHKLISTEEYKRHWGRFSAMKILIPDINLQKDFSNILKPMFAEKENLWNQNQLLTTQRDLLLPRLMSGKLAV